MRKRTKSEKPTLFGKAVNSLGWAWYSLKLKVSSLFPKREKIAKLGVKRRKDAFFVYGMLLLPLIQFGIFYIGVNINSILMTFQRYVDGEYQWAGFYNFEFIWKDFISQDIFGSVWDSAKSRWVWLGVNLCTAFFASRVISAFDGTISKVVALAALMPVVAGMAGNSGNQTLTLLVRSMAMGQVTDANTTRLLKKEMLVALLNGLVWGVIAGLCVWGLYHDSAQGMMLGGVMALAMLLNIVLGAAMGLAVPLVLKALNKDPAMGGSVLLTFMTDSGGFLIFLGLASVFFQ